MKITTMISQALALVLPTRPVLNLMIPDLICLMMYPESLPRIRGNKRKFRPGIKAKGVLNRHPMNLRGFLLNLHAGLKGNQKYLTDLAMYTETSVPLRSFGTMTNSPSFQTRSSEFKSVFCGESPNIAKLEHRISPTMY
jgi:hypothetical protein